MADRVTKKQLDYMLGEMGKLMNMPVNGEFTTSGMKRKPGQNLYKRDFITLDHAYGGYVPVIVHKESGSQSYIGRFGLSSHVSARECYAWMRAFVSGYAMAKTPKKRW